MTRGEAEALLGMVRGNWQKMFLDQFGESMWIRYLQEQDVAQATEAFTTLTRQRDMPTIADFRSVITSLQMAQARDLPALPEPEFAREMPAWFKGWLVARASKDHRTWPEQKDGYDNLQNEHVHYRTYVWPEQELMVEDERSHHEQRGAGLSAAQLGTLLSSIGVGR